MSLYTFKTPPSLSFFSHYKYRKSSVFIKIHSEKLHFQKTHIRSYCKILSAYHFISKSSKYGNTIRFICLLCFFVFFNNWAPSYKGGSITKNPATPPKKNLKIFLFGINRWFLIYLKKKLFPAKCLCKIIFEKHLYKWTML